MCEEKKLSEGIEEENTEVIVFRKYFLFFGIFLIILAILSVIKLCSEPELNGLISAGLLFGITISLLAGTFLVIKETTKYFELKKIEKIEENKEKDSISGSLCSKKNNLSEGSEKNNSEPLNNTQEGKDLIIENDSLKEFEENKKEKKEEGESEGKREEYSQKNNEIKEEK